MFAFLEEVDLLKIEKEKSSSVCIWTHEYLEWKRPFQGWPNYGKGQQQCYSFSYDDLQYIYSAVCFSQQESNEELFSLSYSAYCDFIFLLAEGITSCSPKKEYLMWIYNCSVNLFELT